MHINDHTNHFTPLYNSCNFSQTNPSTDPLLIWMTGGPGTTSLLALFCENGPFIINKNGEVKLREYSWHCNHNIIFIDNPIGAGFSYTENEQGYTRNITQIGQDVVTALLQFFQIFPEMRMNDFYVIGESYGGKFVSAVSHAIMMYNKQEKTKINLKGLAYGNGITDPINQMDRSSFIYQIGLVDRHGQKYMADIEEEIRCSIKNEEYIKAIDLFNTLIPRRYIQTPSVFTNLTGYTYIYNYLQHEQPEVFNYYVSWVQRNGIRRALHVGDTPFHVHNPKVPLHQKGDMIKSVAHLIVDLLKDYKVLIYSGNLDISVPYTTTENFLWQLKWSGTEEYRKAVRKEWWVGKELAGYSKTARNLIEVTVRNSGHRVPMDQPLWAWELISRFTRNEKI